MHKKLFFLSLFVSFGSYAMESEKDFSACQKIEQIKPDASSQDFLKLATLLQKAKISVCDCIKKLSQDRIDATKPALEKEWGITQKHWKDIETFKEKTAQEDGKFEGKPVIKSHGAIFEDEFLIYLADQFAQIGRKNSTIHVLWDEPGEPAAVFRELLSNIENPIDHNNKRVNYENLAAGEHIIKMGELLFQFSTEGKRGMFAHEIKGHVVEDDSIAKQFLWINASLNNPGKKVDDFVDSFSGQQISCAQEARADQVPAACCINSSDARDIERMLHELKINTAQDANFKDPLHPPITERLAMATIIRKLKEAEEQLNSKKS